MDENREPLKVRIGEVHENPRKVHLHFGPD